MIDDFETVKLIGLSALFVVLVVAAVVIMVRDCRRHRRAHEQRVRQQVEFLKRARVEAERQRRLEQARTRAADAETEGFRPSTVATPEASQPPARPAVSYISI